MNNSWKDDVECSLSQSDTRMLWYMSRKSDNMFWISWSSPKKTVFYSFSRLNILIRFEHQEIPNWPSQEQSNLYHYLQLVWLNAWKLIYKNLFLVRWFQLWYISLVSSCAIIRNSFYWRIHNRLEILEIFDKKMPIQNFLRLSATSDVISQYKLTQNSTHLMDILISLKMIYKKVLLK